MAFLGLRPDVPDLLAASDVFVSGSHWEGAPVSLLEALANGLPCVVTDVGDNRAVLTGTPGILVGAGDTEALAAALRAMIDDPDLRLRCAAPARARALERYGANAWVERLLDLYAEQTLRVDWREASAG